MNTGSVSRGGSLNTPKISTGIRSRVSESDSFLRELKTKRSVDEKITFLAGKISSIDPSAPEDRQALFNNVVRGFKAVFQQNSPVESVEEFLTEKLGILIPEQKELVVTLAKKANNEKQLPDLAILRQEIAKLAVDQSESSGTNFWIIHSEVQKADSPFAVLNSLLGDSPTSESITHVLQMLGTDSLGPNQKVLSDWLGTISSLPIKVAILDEIYLTDDMQSNQIASFKGHLRQFYPSKRLWDIFSEAILGTQDFDIRLRLLRNVVNVCVEQDRIYKEDMDGLSQDITRFFLSVKGLKTESYNPFGEENEILNIGIQNLELPDNSPITKEWLKATMDAVFTPTPIQDAITTANDQERGEEGRKTIEVDAAKTGNRSRFFASWIDAQVDKTNKDLNTRFPKSEQGPAEQTPPPNKPKSRFPIFSKTPPPVSPSLAPPPVQGIETDGYLTEKLTRLCETVLQRHYVLHEGEFETPDFENEALKNALNELDAVKKQLDKRLHGLFATCLQAAITSHIDDNVHEEVASHISQQTNKVLERARKAVAHDIRSKSPEELVKIIQDNVVEHGDLKLAINCLDALYAQATSQQSRKAGDLDAIQKLIEGLTHFGSGVRDKPLLAERPQTEKDRAYREVVLKCYEWLVAINQVESPFDPKVVSNCHLRLFSLLTSENKREILKRKLNDEQAHIDKWWSEQKEAKNWLWGAVAFNFENLTNAQIDSLWAEIIRRMDTRGEKIKGYINDSEAILQSHASEALKQSVMNPEFTANERVFLWLKSIDFSANLGGILGEALGNVDEWRRADPTIKFEEKNWKEFNTSLDADIAKLKGLKFKQQVMAGRIARNTAVIKEELERLQNLYECYELMADGPEKDKVKATIDRVLKAAFGDLTQNKYLKFGMNMGTRRYASEGAQEAGWVIANLKPKWLADRLETMSHTNTEAILHNTAINRGEAKRALLRMQAEVNEALVKAQNQVASLAKAKLDDFISNQQKKIHDLHDLLFGPLDSKREANVESAMMGIKAAKETKNGEAVKFAYLELVEALDKALENGGFIINSGSAEPSIKYRLDKEFSPLLKELLLSVRQSQHGVVSNSEIGIDHEMDSKQLLRALKAEFERGFISETLWDDLGVGFHEKLAKVLRPENKTTGMEAMQLVYQERYENLNFLYKEALHIQREIWKFKKGEAQGGLSSLRLVELANQLKHLDKNFIQQAENIRKFVEFSSVIQKKKSESKYREHLEDKITRIRNNEKLEIEESSGVLPITKPLQTLISGDVSKAIEARCMLEAIQMFSNSSDFSSEYNLYLMHTFLLILEQYQRFDEDGKELFNSIDFEIGSTPKKTTNNADEAFEFIYKALMGKLLQAQKNDVYELHVYFSNSSTYKPRIKKEIVREISGFKLRWEQASQKKGTTVLLDSIAKTVEDHLVTLKISTLSIAETVINRSLIDQEQSVKIIRDHSALTHKRYILKTKEDRDGKVKVLGGNKFWLHYSPILLHLGAIEQKRSGQLTTSWAEIGEIKGLVYKLGELYVKQMNEELHRLNSLLEAPTHKPVERPVTFELIPDFVFKEVNGIDGKKIDYGYGFDEIGEMLNTFFTNIFKDISGCSYENGTVKFSELDNFSKFSRIDYFDETENKKKVERIHLDIPFPPSLSRQIVSGEYLDVFKVIFHRSQDLGISIPVRIEQEVSKLLSNKSTINIKFLQIIQDFEQTLSPEDIHIFSSEGSTPAKEYLLRVFREYADQRGVDRSIWIDDVYVSKAEFAAGYVFSLSSLETAYEKRQAFKYRKQIAQNLRREDFDAMTERLRRRHPILDRKLVSRELGEGLYPRVPVQEGLSKAQIEMFKTQEFNSFLLRLSENDRRILARYTVENPNKIQEILSAFSNTYYFDGWCQCSLGMIPYIAYEMESVNSEGFVVYINNRFDLQKRCIQEILDTVK